MNLPAVPSLSLTLSPFQTRTTVRWGTEKDSFFLNDKPADTGTARKIGKVLDLIAPGRPSCEVTSHNSFPTAAGLASSSSGFAALTLAGAAAAGQDIDRVRLSAIARQGSGSACRSLFGGFVEWKMGERADGQDSHGVELAGPEFWDVEVLVAVVQSGPKETASTDGMNHCALTSPYYPAWVATALADVEGARLALGNQDLDRLGAIMEHSTLKMHACMMASDPTILYWRGGTLAAVDKVRELRKNGLSCYYTMDAGPNVKVLCHARDSARVAEALSEVGVRVDRLTPGHGAWVE